VIFKLTVKHLQALCSISLISGIAPTHWTAISMVWFTKAGELTLNTKEGYLIATGSWTDIQRLALIGVAKLAELEFTEIGEE